MHDHASPGTCLVGGASTQDVLAELVESNAVDLCRVGLY